MTEQSGRRSVRKVVGYVDNGVTERWTCWWIPLEYAHVLCAGFGARIGGLVLEEPDE
jgi:hypothetical protein